MYNLLDMPCSVLYISDKIFVDDRMKKIGLETHNSGSNVCK